MPPPMAKPKPKRRRGRPSKFIDPGYLLHFLSTRTKDGGGPFYTILDAARVLRCSRMTINRCLDQEYEWASGTSTLRQQVKRERRVENQLRDRQ